MFKGIPWCFTKGYDTMLLKSYISYLLLRCL